MKTKQILPIGQIVYIGDRYKRDIKGEITAIKIMKESTEYEVTWWSGGVRKTEWVLKDDLSVKGKLNKKSLGFAANK